MDLAAAGAGLQLDLCLHGFGAARRRARLHSAVRKWASHQPDALGLCALVRAHPQCRPCIVHILVLLSPRLLHSGLGALSQTHLPEGIGGVAAASDRRRSCRMSPSATFAFSSSISTSGTATIPPI